MNAGVTEKAVLYSRSHFSWEFGEIGVVKPDGARLLREAPAAFGRLCVETGKPFRPEITTVQPPSGGCVLKQRIKKENGIAVDPAAFGRLCVETGDSAIAGSLQNPAAFGRLCVETSVRVRLYEKGKTSRLRAAVC